MYPEDHHITESQKSVLALNLGSVLTLRLRPCFAHYAFALALAFALVLRITLYALRFRLRLRPCFTHYAFAFALALALALIMNLNFLICRKY
jgi:hypothetical protein